LKEYCMSIFFSHSPSSLSCYPAALPKEWLSSFFPKNVCPKGFYKLSGIQVPIKKRAFPTYADATAKHANPISSVPEICAQRAFTNYPGSRCNLKKTIPLSLNPPFSLPNQTPLCHLGHRSGVHKSKNTKYKTTKETQPELYLSATYLTLYPNPCDLWIPGQARHDSERGAGSDLFLKNQAGFKKVYADLPSKNRNTSRFFAVEPGSRTVRISPAGTDFREIREGDFGRNRDCEAPFAASLNTDLYSQTYGDSTQKHPISSSFFPGNLCPKGFYKLSGIQVQLKKRAFPTYTDSPQKHIDPTTKHCNLSPTFNLHINFSTKETSL
jgi:hypothetical protein